ncbi:amino acid transporter, partial [Streptomyces sp. NPDC029721]
MATPTRTSPLRAWMLEGLTDRPRQQSHADTAHEGRPWWRVMCLTGLDYFSTLGYQPGIAALAAGLLSPVATIVLVLLTLFGALPVYRRVAEESPHGEGSIAMLERLLSFWKGKLFVLTLLGFAATDFLITITLSAADATAHMVENPHLTSTLNGHQVLITLILIALLGAVFLKGFSEAIGVAVVLVATYLALNAVVVAVGLWQVITEPHLVADWSDALTTEHGNPFMMIAIALVVFPKLALGLSGFETGVAVMPHVQGAGDDTPGNPAGRIRGTKKLLTTAAVIMSVFLICSSFVTTLLIPADAFKSGGEANGRALAYLAHEHLGSAFGTVYDVSTILILWFAGSSAMAGLLNLMPRYLPRYGMAPHWARALRPMV